MLSFTSGLGPEIESFVVFISESHEYRKRNGIIPSNVTQKIDSYIKVLKTKRKNEIFSSIDISDKQKCFIVKIKKNYESSYPQESGGEFFSYLKKFQSISNVVFFIDSSLLEKEKSNDFFSEFIF